jgi:uncharacterized protein (DUF305 family)
MKDMHQAMNSMMQQMKTITSTGDPDHDFAMMMKHHHQGAIDMAKPEVNGGQGATLKALAQKIIKDQPKEISVIDNFMQEHQPSGLSDYGKNAMGMMTDMGSMQMKDSSLDAMFASMMVPHYQEAVKMAEAYLKRGINTELKQIAQNIIATQPKEIEELRTWLDKSQRYLTILSNTYSPFLPVEKSL